MLPVSNRELSSRKRQTGCNVYAVINHDVADGCDPVGIHDRSVIICQRRTGHRIVADEFQDLVVPGIACILSRRVRTTDEFQIFGYERDLAALAGPECRICHGVYLQRPGIIGSPHRDLFVFPVPPFITEFQNGPVAVDYAKRRIRQYLPGSEKRVRIRIDTKTDRQPCREMTKPAPAHGAEAGLYWKKQSSST